MYCSNGYPVFESSTEELTFFMQEQAEWNKKV
jgi:hypothetical protein